MTKDELKVVLAEVFDERARIDAETHGDHHAWIKERIESERARKEMCWEIAKSVAQYSVLGILGGIWYWIQNGHWPQ